MNLRIKGGPEQEKIPLKEGQSVLDALKAAEIYLTASCGGKGTCGKCRIKIVEGRAMTGGAAKLTLEERESGLALACRTFAEEDIVIEIPESSRIVVGDKIAVSRAKDLLGLVSSMGGGIGPAISEARVELTPPTIGDHTSDLDRLRLALGPLGLKDLGFSRDFLSTLGDSLRAANWQACLRHAGGFAVSLMPAGDCGENKKKKFGAAVDIGTTTIVVYLVELGSGSLVDAGSTYNSQIRYGDDVITRIVHATEGGGLEELRGTVLEDINGLINATAQRHGIKAGDIELTVISGNTTMSHLFWGLPPGSIREEPYVPTVSYFPLLKGAEAGLSMDRSGAVYTMPCIASYVGGDIVSGVLASGMTRKEEIALFMDIGTNGEVAVGNNEWLMTAACSAGPCFEGSGIRHGMRATEGAIESVKITPGLGVEIGVIGNNSVKQVSPRGICGSGMIDAISEMFLKGIIDRKGKFVPRADAPAGGVGSIRQGDWGPEFVLSEGPAGAVTLTRVDIENILRAKAAIYAGVSTLIKEVGLDLSAIEKVYIAGGFGNYLNVEKAVILGMLPDIPREKFVFLGNTSITGAYLGLVSEGFLREAEQIASKMTYLELSVSPGFMEEYMSALFLPHTDSGQFPTVERLLEGR